VSVNHHTLSDFRVDHQAALDRLMTDLLAFFQAQGLVTLDRVAQDGMKVRASAGAASFHRGDSLRKALAAAKEHVARMRKEAEKGESSETARERAARRRAAEDTEAKLVRALEELQEIESTPRKSEREPRVSSTDPEARVMKMADGGFRPAYNVQIASDTKSRLIVDIGVVKQGNDFGQAPPRMQAVKRRLGQLPKELLVDGGFASLRSIDELEQAGIRVYAPVMARENARVKKGAKRPTDTKGQARWRQRMATAKAKKIYIERGSVAEPVNGDLRRWRGLSTLFVRGVVNVTTVCLWSGIAYNLIRGIALGAFA
jgi:hypothetical protein